MISKKVIVNIFIVLLSVFSCANAAETEPQIIFEQPVEETAQPAYKSAAFEPLQLNSGEILFKQAKTKVDTIDPSLAATYYPGGRSANKLVIYTPNYGLHTGTNEFGTEAIVENNIVTSLSGADSTIPADGLVISGHGIAKNWITNNITVGSKVYVDLFNKTITVYTTSDSYTFEAKQKINEARSIMDYYRLNTPNYNYNLPLGHIQSAENYLKIAENEKQNSSVLRQYTQEAIDNANMALKTSLPFIKNELKGVWIRPTETTPEQITATLDNMAANGFNSVFLETYYHGKTIFPSRTMNKYGFTVQNEKFTGFDPLEVWIKEAHKKNIKVHIWFQSFYVGNTPPESEPTSILAVRPDWGNKTKKYAEVPGGTKSAAEHNGYFIDPANPEVQTFLFELLDEIIETYKPDGINLDYVRYPNAAAGNDQNSWGFTEYARNDFKQLYGVDPVELTTSDVLWYDWNQYRRNAVSNFVRKAGKMGRQKDVYMSAVVFPDLAAALANKQQDWRTWSVQDYVDGFTPLFLTYDPKMLTSMMNDVLRIKAPCTDFYAGLFVTFMGGAPEDLVKQIYETRKTNAKGVIIFDWAHTTPVYTSTLMAGAFNDLSKKETTIAASKEKKKFWRKKKKSEIKTKTQTKG